MYYLGLDQSLRNTGWSVLSDDPKPHIVDYGCIKSTTEDDYYRRVQNLEHRLEELLIKWKPEIVFTERVFIPGSKKYNSNSTIHIEFLVHYLLNKQNIKYEVIESASNIYRGWRRTFNLKSGKNKSKEAILGFHKDIKITEHIADSMLILATGYSLYGPAKFIEFIEDNNTIHHDLAQSVFNRKPVQAYK